jgi:hypothetical protein
MTRRRPLAAFLALLALVLPGCGFFGLSCLEIGSLAQRAVGGRAGPSVCHLFGGSDQCCADDDGDGFGECGDLFEAFFFPCGRRHSDCVCVSGGPGPFAQVAPDLTVQGGFATYDVPPFTFDLGLAVAGVSTAHRLAFDVVDDALQTFAGAVTYPAGFAFNGFTALGPADTQIGSYGADLNADGVVDVALPLRAASATMAYADINADGRMTAIDATIEHVPDVPDPGAHTFNLLLPAGGDGAPNIAYSVLAFRAHVALYAGILRNPAADGPYDITGTFTSVDPDTGGASNGTGSSPLSVMVPPVGVMIAPSPVALVDHFLCYKTKASAGKICGATAAANAGALCASDADCGAVAGACGKNKLARGIQVDLGDRFTEFAARAVDVKKALRLCTPADKNDEGRHDDVTHLRGYGIKAARGTPRVAAQRNLEIVNQLGTIVVDAKVQDSLLVPAAKALDAPAAPLGAHVVDAYACYKVKPRPRRCTEDPARRCKRNADCGVAGPCLGTFPAGLQVTVADQFVPAGRRFDVTKPTRLCTPAISDGGPVQSAGGHLMCYQVRPAAGEPPHAKVVGAIHTTTDLGRDRLDTIVEEELCVPSFLVGPG